jgi:hypothetical protein
MAGERIPVRARRSEVIPVANGPAHKHASFANAVVPCFRRRTEDQGNTLPAAR